MGRMRVRHRARTNPHGIVTVTADGFGFVSTAEGSFFIPASKLNGAFDGDEVEVAPIRIDQGNRQRGKEHDHPGDRPSARVVNVIQRAHETVIGRVEIADPFAVVIPNDPRIPYDIFTKRSDRPDVEEGSIVRVRMVEFPSRNTAATGMIEDVLGKGDHLVGDIEALIARHGLQTAFSEATLAAADVCIVDAEEALRAGYRDLRKRFVFTVDPVDARDFDDALSVEPLASGMIRLGVHIADVTRYVAWGSAIDLEARQRATSVYLSDRVLPMLPAHLSNDVCSLMPGVARCTMTVDIVLDEHARVTSVDMYESVILSQARLSYEQAQCFIDVAHRGLGWKDGAEDARREDAANGALALNTAQEQQVHAALAELCRIAEKRRVMRQASGGMDFASTEAKVVLDAEGEPQDVRLRSRTDATSCVEEAMILANECVARRLRDANQPALFRTHEPPTYDALAALVPLLAEFPSLRGIDRLQLASGNPFALQDVLTRVAGFPEDELVSSLVVRSMQRAVYNERLLPHFGLASEAYCHFTSPIRRYPDIVVHRALKTLLHGRGETQSAQETALPFLAEHSSKMERIADAAARESQEFALVRYMERFVGQEFDGVVSGVAKHGVYVRLPNTVEGLVPIRSLGDEYFALDQVRQMLTGEETGSRYRLGQKVAVRIVEAPAHARKLRLRFVG